MHRMLHVVKRQANELRSSLNARTTIQLAVYHEKEILVRIRLNL